MSDDERFPPQWPLPGAVAWGHDRYGLWIDVDFKGVTQRFRWIEPGEFMMGSPKGEPKRREQGEGPQHRVRLTQGFWLADTACTQGLWQAVMGEEGKPAENPSHFKGDDRLPVEQVSWADVQGFLGRLGQLLPAGVKPALPTEAQWEYACRAGSQTPFSFGETITPEQVNYDGGYPYAGAMKGLNRGKTVPVASLPANAWGLYEMHGNVWEWCADGLRIYLSQDEVDPVGPEGGPRAYRGGSWCYDARNARSAYRHALGPGLRNHLLGFRLALRSMVRSGQAAERPAAGGARRV